MFIGQWLRRAVKPACISAHRLRARARCIGSRGHSRNSGCKSASVSAIASVSHTGWPSTRSTGTLPTGECCASARWKAESGAKLSKRSLISSKAMPKWRISTQGRIDHDE